MLAILFKETKWDNVAFKPITDSFHEVNEGGMKAELWQEIKLASFLPDRNNFYRYIGSLVISFIDIFTISFLNVE